MAAVLSGTICMNPSAGDWEVSTMPKTQISNAGGDQHGTKYDIVLKMQNYLRFAPKQRFINFYYLARTSQQDSCVEKYCLS